MSGVKTETVIYINSYVPCDCQIGWYESNGQVITEDLEAILSSHQNKDVVGWYKFRRETSLAMSLRERAIHRNLRKFFQSQDPSLFLFLLANGYSSSNASTHTNDHVFISCSDRSTKILPVTVLNLGDTAHSEYKVHPSHANNTEHGMFATTVQTATNHFMDDMGKIQSVFGIHSLNQNLQRELMGLCERVAASETEVGRLSEDIHNLQEQLEYCAERTNQGSKERETFIPPLASSKPVEDLWNVHVSPATSQSGFMTQSANANQLDKSASQLDKSARQLYKSDSQLDMPPKSSLSQTSRPSIDDLLFLDEPTGAIGDVMTSQTDCLSQHSFDPLPIQPQIQPSMLPCDTTNLSGNCDTNTCIEQDALSLSNSSPNQPNKSKDAFSFIQDMLASAKGIVGQTSSSILGNGKPAPQGTSEVNMDANFAVGSHLKSQNVQQSDSDVQSVDLDEPMSSPVF